ncbi:MAG: hypothetical protein M1827_001410 [Pycnora praestabilis]|nr:MAG: hypothetical protein M1827_001410 [Pycnora praestabilis]
MSRAAPRIHAGVGGPISGLVHRPSLADSVRTASDRSSTSSSSTGNSNKAIGDEKPVASANGISVSICLAEPVLFLQGFDQNDVGSRTTTMLRGSLHLRVSKNAKIKGISLKFRGKAETEWPEGIPPKKLEFKDTDTIMNHTWTFFNSQLEQAERGHCADFAQLAKDPLAPAPSFGAPGISSSSFDQFARSSTSMSSSSGFSGSKSSASTSREQKRLSLQANQSRSFGKGESSQGGPTVAQKGFRTFYPGDYIYNFELPLDSRLPETINVELGTVNYELEALVERSGAFRTNLVGAKEVMLIRAPSESSLEQIEPIAISRNWEDQLHYDIVISGKSFPLGAQVPIAFKLIPLAKVQCHRIKVFVTENIEYYTGNKRVHRLEPTRKIQLFEKRADGPSNSTYPGSSIRVTAGGGIDFDHREAAARGDEHVIRDTTNLLGNLEGEANIGPTEMEFNVQLPTCQQMRDQETKNRIHFDTTFHNIQVHHWIKIVMRLSKPDATDPGKRRHFEISIDSPFHILSCQATQANTSLPAYSSPSSTSDTQNDTYECGCPGALRRRNSPSKFPTMAGLVNGNHVNSAEDSPSNTGLARPQQAHIHNPNFGVQRPIHMLRNPSFNPPAFEDVEPPPPLITPPPEYNSIVSGADGSGLADYFSRLADATAEDDDDDRLNGRSRIDLPLTPGGRVNRSMDERRTWLPIGHLA